MSGAPFINSAVPNHIFSGDGGLTGKAQKPGIYWLESALIFVLLFQFSAALIALLLSENADMTQESILGRVLWYPSYIVIIYLGARTWPNLVRVTVFNPLLILCVLWCGISYFWSIEPPITLRRSIALLMTTLFGLILAARFEWGELIKRFAFVFLIIALLSLFLGLFFPELGRVQKVHIGAWRGAWTSKNSFGTNMAIATMLMLCACAVQPKRWWFWGGGAGVCMMLVLLSTSKGGLLSALIAIFGFGAIFIFRRYKLLRVPLIYVVVLSIVVFSTLVLLLPETMLGIIGKEPSLTGRTDIWDSLIRAIRQKPVLGYGYGTFWKNKNGPSYWVRFGLEWGVPSAHNGWVETWLSAGIIAVGLFAVLYVSTLFLAVKRLFTGGIETYWVILGSVLFFTISLSESTVLMPNKLSWVMFVALSAKLFSLKPAPLAPSRMRASKPPEQMHHKTLE